MYSEMKALTIFIAGVSEKSISAIRFYGRRQAGSLPNLCAFLILEDMLQKEKNDPDFHRYIPVDDIVCIRGDLEKRARKQSTDEKPDNVIEINGMPEKIAAFRRYCQKHKRSTDGVFWEWFSEKS